MALHTPRVEELHDAFAVAQLHHEMKIVGIAATFDEAKELVKETSNLGYPCFIFNVPMALVPRGAKYAQASYK
jgi:hypothetical protein